MADLRLTVPPAPVGEATTAEVVAAAGVHPTTLGRWVRLRLLPAPRRVLGGRSGNPSMWPAHAPAQARWVKRQLDAGNSNAEVLAMLERGEFAKEVARGPA